MRVVHGVGALIECNGKILILRRALHDTQGNLWGLPAGGKEQNELSDHAIIREVFEETGLRLRKGQFVPLGNHDWKDDTVHIVFEVFRVSLKAPFQIRLDPKEHSEFAWVSPAECFKKKDLVLGFHGLLKKVYAL